MVRLPRTSARSAGLQCPRLAFGVNRLGLTSDEFEPKASGTSKRRDRPAPRLRLRSLTGGRRPSSSFLLQVYSFVPIPGAQQHKRPRRRYEEIDRMYKCGWNGCEKAYGTLNHLNAHVTMQSHGAKRTPEGKSKP